ncbi:MAG: type II toxin-antitoxin system RelE/ParE family toxin [Kiloniellaceae bacterium]
MIISFADKRTEALFTVGRHRRIASDVATRAKQQLDLLDAVVRLQDLCFPPSNHFERLAGTKPTRYSIRVTRKYRITFEWTGKDAENVRFEDYH